MGVRRPRTGGQGVQGPGVSAAASSPLAVVEVTAVACVALHLQLALAVQGVTGDLQQRDQSGTPCPFPEWTGEALLS